MKTSTHNGARKKLPFFSFGGARPPPNSNMNLNPNVPGSGPQNSENSSEPMGAGAGAGTSSAVLRGSETDDEWYIPYKGPYELPSTPSSGYYRGPQRAQSASSSNVLPPSRSRSAAMASSSLRRSRSRDSWGDPIYPAGDSAADESGYARDEAPTTGAELDRRGRSRAGRGRDMDSDRGRRSGSLTVAISKSRLPGFNAAFVNDSVGGNAVNSEVKTRTWKNEDKEIEDKAFGHILDQSRRHRHHHRPVLISQSSTSPTGAIGSSPQPSPPRDTHNSNTHRRRPSTAPSSPTRFRGSSISVSRSPSPSPPAAASSAAAPASSKRSRSKPETGAGLLSPGLGLGLDSIYHSRRRSTPSVTGAGNNIARPHSSTSSDFASASSALSAPTRTVPAKLTYIDLDTGSMGGVGKSPVPAFGGSRSRPPMDGKGLDLASLFAPTQKLFKKFSKLGLGSKEEGRKKDEREREEREREEGEREREIERGREQEAAAAAAELRIRSSSHRPRPRSHSRPVLRIHPPVSGGVSKQNRAYRHVQRTAALATGSPSSAEQPYYLSNSNRNAHARNRSSSLPSQAQPPPPPSQVAISQYQYHSQSQPERHQRHAQHTHARDLNAHHHPSSHSPEFETERHTHSHARSHHRNQHPQHQNPQHQHQHQIQHPHLNTYSDSHSLSTYASTSTAIATQPSLGTHSKLSPSSSGGGGGGGDHHHPVNRLEVEDMERESREADGEEEEEEEEGYAYGYRFGGAMYVLQSSSSGDESQDLAGRRVMKKKKKKHHPYAYDHLENAARRRGSSHPPFYSPAVLYQYGSTTAAGDGGNDGMKWVGMATRQAQRRLSPIPSGPSVPSLNVPSVGAAGASVGGGGGGAAGGSDKGSGMIDMTMWRNSISTPDLRFGVDEHDHEQKHHVDEDGGSGRGSASTSTKVRGRSRLEGDAPFKEWEKREKEKERERKLLSAQSPHAFLLPRPRFKVKTLERGESPGPVGGPGARHQEQRPLLVLVNGGGKENAAKVGGGGPAEVHVKLEQGDGSRRSYSRDDLSLLSLDRVLEERERLERDRKVWQARAVKSLGNKQSRAVSRSRSKSLTLAGRMMDSSHTKGKPTRRYQQQQSNIDYLAARACVGDQDFSPLLEYSEDGPWLARRPKQKGAKHERKPSASTSSGAATSSGGASSEGHHPPVKGHQRDDSWSQSAVKLARSLPQMCGIMRDSTEEQRKNGNNGQLLEEALSREDTKVIRLLDPAAASLGDHQVVGSWSPVPSGISDGGVGIAISTPPISGSQGPSYVLSDHPYAFGPDSPDGRVRADVTGQGRDADLPIRIPAHPYAHRGLPTGGGTPEYAGRHPTSHPSHLLESLGLSEVSARHRLPPQLIIGQHQPSSRGVDDQPSREQGRRPLYVMVDSRNSYQALRPYVRADSEIAPDEKLWVTYSPGVVREVLAKEVFQYSPREEGEGNLPASSSSQESAGRRDQPDDLLFRKYSTVYQDTAAMGEALADAMFNQRASTVAEPRYSSVSGSAAGDGEVAVEDVPAESETQPRQGSAHNVTDYQRHLRGRVSGPSSSSSSKSLGVLPPPTVLTRVATNTSKEASAYSSPATPSAPRINSPNNLEPFHDLFYRPPYGSESDSHSSHQVEPYDESPSVDTVPWDVGSTNSQRTGSGLTSLVQQIGDEVAQMALERQGSSGRYSHDGNLPDIPPRTSSLARPGVQSGHVNSEVGPLHFLIQNSPQQQELRRPYNMARSGRFLAFDPANAIPEDIEVSEHPSSDEKPQEDDTARYPVVNIDPALTPISSQFNHPSQLRYRAEENQSEEHLPAEPLGSSRRDALCSSQLSTYTLSRMSTLSEFPDPPETITSEQMSVFSSHLDDNTIT